MRFSRNISALVCGWGFVALLLGAYSCSASENPSSGGTDPGKQDDTEIVSMLKNCVSIKTVQTWKETTLADWVTYTKLQTLKSRSDRPATIYIVKTAADASRAALKTGCNVPGADGLIPMVMPSTIAEKSNSVNEEVVAVIGGDFFRWMDDQLANRHGIDGGCRGPVHHRGKVYQDHFVPQKNWTHQALSFLAVDKNGKIVIGDAADYDGVKADLQECTGGGYRFLRNGKVCKGYDLVDDNGNYTPLEDSYPFSTIGVREDGTIIMMIVDGRNESVSTGVSYGEAGEIMKSLGCVNAVMLDGGGSAQLVLKNANTGKYVLQNKATDGGQRQMRTFWMITNKK